MHSAVDGEVFYEGDCFHGDCGWSVIVLETFCGMRVMWFVVLFPFVCSGWFLVSCACTDGGRVYSRCVWIG